MKLELHLLEPGRDVGAVWEWSHVDLPPFRVTFRRWAGVAGVRENVRLVADDEVTPDLCRLYALRRCGRHRVYVKEWQKAGAI